MDPFKFLLLVLVCVLMLGAIWLGLGYIGMESTLRTILMLVLVALMLLFMWKWSPAGTS